MPIKPSLRAPEPGDWLSAQWPVRPVASDPEAWLPPCAKSQTSLHVRPWLPFSVLVWLSHFLPDIKYKHSLGRTRHSSRDQPNQREELGAYPASSTSLPHGARHTTRPTLNPPLLPLWTHYLMTGTGLRGSDSGCVRVCESVPARALRATGIVSVGLTSTCWQMEKDKDGVDGPPSPEQSQLLGGGGQPGRPQERSKWRTSALDTPIVLDETPRSQNAVPTALQFSTEAYWTGTGQQGAEQPLGTLTGNPLGTTCQHTSCLVKRQKFKLVQPK